MRRLILMGCLLACAAGLGPAAAQPPPTVESVVARYMAAQSYCDSGKSGSLYGEGKFAGTAFTRCASRDGRFKLVEQADQPRRTTSWSDGVRFFRHSDYGEWYHESAIEADDGILFGLYRDRSQIFPIFVLRYFTRDARNLTNPEQRARYFQSYKQNRALSSPELAVFDRFDDPGEKTGERLWIRTGDQTIVRFEVLGGGLAASRTEIESVRFDRPLATADLWHEPPRMVRYSLQNNPRVFLSALFVATLVLSLLVWAAWFAAAEEPEDVRETRRRLWRWYLRALVVTAIGLAILAVITTVSPGSGHPPAIVLVLILGVWAAGFFVLAATFLLASYPMQLFGRRRRVE